ncbi:hypothetical protein DL96DRAFT_1625624, partial [Flagelloscypha sp. PMI_526]
MLLPFRLKRLSMVYISEATRTIAFSLISILIAVLLGGSLRATAELRTYLDHQVSSAQEETGSNRVDRQEIAVHTGFLIAFLLLIFRCCWWYV